MSCKITDIVKEIKEVQGNYPGIKGANLLSTSGLHGLKTMIEVGSLHKNEITTLSEPVMKTQEEIDKSNQERYPILNSLPGYKKDQNNMTYAGIGSRQTPDAVKLEMEALATELSKYGYDLKTGDVPKGKNGKKDDGADQAFTRGAPDTVELFNPIDKPDQHTKKTFDIAREVHPNPSAIDNGKNPDNVWKLQARNTRQVFGKNLDTPVDFVIAWTKDGKATGGTGQALRMAEAKGIPIINLYDKDWRTKLDAVLNTSGSRQQNEKIEVNSYQGGLEYALTNPTHTSPSGYLRSEKGYKNKEGKMTNWSKSQAWWRKHIGKKKIVFNGTEYLDVEQAYQKNKSENLADSDYDLMVDLLKIKLDTYPVLIQGIKKKGGLDYLNKLTHNPTSKTGTRWQTNGKGWFTKALIEAYNKALPGYKEPVMSAFDKLLMENALIHKKYEESKKSTTKVNGGTVSVIADSLSESQMDFAKTEMEKILNDSSIDKGSNTNIAKQVAVAYGPINYSYSGGGGKTITHKAKPTPVWLNKLARSTEQELGKPEGYYNHVLFNRFADNEGIGRHPDAEKIYKNTKGSIGSVAIYSIGDTRTPHVIWGTSYGDRPKGTDGQFKAESGALVEMDTGSLYHEVAKAKGTRYSITFRHIPENQLTTKKKPVVENKSKVGDILKLKNASTDNAKNARYRVVSIDSKGMMELVNIHTSKALANKRNMNAFIKDDAVSGSIVENTDENKKNIITRVEALLVKVKEAIAKHGEDDAYTDLSEVLEQVIGNINQATTEQMSAGYHAVIKHLDELEVEFSNNSVVAHKEEIGTTGSKKPNTKLMKAGNIAKLTKAGSDNAKAARYEILSINDNGQYIVRNIKSGETLKNPLHPSRLEFVSEKQNKSEFGKISKNKDLFEKISARLKELYPNISSKMVDDLVDENGKKILGQALKSGIEYSNKASLDTMPHEYAHIYVNMLENTQLIDNSVKYIMKTKKLNRLDAKEYLVKMMGENFAEKMGATKVEKNLISRIWSLIKNFFNKITDEEQTVLDQHIDMVSNNFFIGQNQDAIRFTPREGYSKMNAETVFKKHKTGVEVLNIMQNKLFPGSILTGSLALSTQVSVYRKGEGDLHDIDMIMPKIKNDNFSLMRHEFMFEFPDAYKAYNFSSKIIDFEGNAKYVPITTYIVPPNGTQIVDVRKENGNYGKVIHYQILDAKTKKVVGTYDATTKVDKFGVSNIDTENFGDGQKAIIVDLMFTKEQSEDRKFYDYKSKELGREVRMAETEGIFSAKKVIGDESSPRSKDIMDYNLQDVDTTGSDESTKLSKENQTLLDNVLKLDSKEC